MTETNAQQINALEQLTNIKKNNRVRSNKYYSKNKIILKERRQTKQRQKEEEKERLFNIDEYLNVIKLNYGELSKIFILVYLILNYGIYDNLFILDEKEDTKQEDIKDITNINFLIIPNNKEHNNYIMMTTNNKIINEYGGKNIKLLNNYISDLIQRYKEQYNIKYFQFLFTNHKHLKEHVKECNKKLNIDMTLNNLFNIYKTNLLNKQNETMKEIFKYTYDNINIEIIKPEEDETIILRPIRQPPKYNY